MNGIPARIRTAWPAKAAGNPSRGPMKKLLLCSLYAVLSVSLFCLAACSSPSTSGLAGAGYSGNSIPKDNTLAALTASNTAACPADGQLPPWCQHAFNGQFDSRSGVATPRFDPPAGNVSDEDIHSYFPRSRSGVRIFANFMLGFCTSPNSTYCNNNVQTGYTADDPQTVAAQAADLQRRHIDGAIMSWDGSQTSMDTASLLFQQWADRHACSGGNCSLSYIIMYNAVSLNYDVGSTGIPGTTGQSCSGFSGAGYEDCVVAHLRNEICYMNGMHWGSPAYEKAGGRPILQIFPDEEVIPSIGPAPSWADVWVQIGHWADDLPHNCAFAPYNANNGVPLIVFENEGGFSEQSSSGSYYWLQPAGVDPAADQFVDNISGAATGTLDSFFISALASQGKIAFSGAFKGFNSIDANWGKGRIMDQQCGQTWIKSLTESTRYYRGGAPYLQISTWNDYNEGTEIESGISNCYEVSARINGATLEWSLDPTSSAASLDTVSHIEIYDSPDGTNVTLVATRPAVAHGVWHISGLPPGKQTLYVRMVGKNSILNRISPGVAYGD
jgi:hypothetical protein